MQPVPPNATAPAPSQPTPLVCLVHLPTPTGFVQAQPQPGGPSLAVPLMVPPGNNVVIMSGRMLVASPGAGSPTPTRAQMPSTMLPPGAAVALPTFRPSRYGNSTTGSTPQIAIQMPPPMFSLGAPVGVPAVRPGSYGNQVVASHTLGQGHNVPLQASAAAATTAAAEPPAAIASFPPTRFPQQLAIEGAAVMRNEQMQQPEMIGAQIATRDETHSTSTQSSQLSVFDYGMTPEVSSSGSGGSSLADQPQRRNSRRGRPRGGPEREARREHQRHVARREREVAMILQDSVAHTRRLQAGGIWSAAAVAQLYGAVLPLSLDKQGCRLVQLALEQAQGASRARLCEELHGHVRQAMGSDHANHVLQKIVKVMPFEIARFIADELRGIAADACRHGYGSRIVCGLEEHFGGLALEELEKDIVAGDVLALILHKQAHQVIKAILEHGTPASKRRIAEALAEDLWESCTHKYGSRVVEKALESCSYADVTMMVATVIDEDILLPLTQEQYGRYVVGTLIRCHGAFFPQLLHDVCNAPPEVRENRHYQELLAALKVRANDAEVRPE